MRLNILHCLMLTAVSLVVLPFLYERNVARRMERDAALYVQGAAMAVFVNYDIATRICLEDMEVAVWEIRRRKRRRR